MYTTSVLVSNSQGDLSEGYTRIRTKKKTWPIPILDQNNKTPPLFSRIVAGFLYGLCYEKYIVPFLFYLRGHLYLIGDS